MKKPIIGITVNYDPTDAVARTCGLGIVGQDFNYVAGDYVMSIEKAGGTPFLIPQIYDFDDLPDMLKLCDGILVSGGHDVDPRFYGERNTYSGTLSPDRDAQDIEVTRYGWEHKIPLLGICRGIQIINVAAGGTLYQDVTKELGAPVHFGDSYPRNIGWHSVRIEDESRLADIYGKDQIMVNSYHHQAVRDLGKNLKATAVTEEGIIECLEDTNDSYTVAVQWHPEMMFDSDEQAKLFKDFVDACRG
ncbi:MAG: gamma-glutamyl-gamma-aminobutyrate hydrolase family protein [Eubacteriales bacterium]|nr:gamma-glutamyl-gamma-aminobutyrate hydrolase family protein [Eubacteriales bacterium]